MLCMYGATMTYHTRIARRRNTRTKADLLISGAGTISLDQQMRIARKALSHGSVREDWESVMRDIESAISSAKRESEAA